LGPARRDPIRFFPSNWDINVFASLPNLAAIARMEKASVSSVTSGIISLE
jgi:hypothetical protein